MPVYPLAHRRAPSNVDASNANQRKMRTVRGIPRTVTRVHVRGLAVHPLSIGDPPAFRRSFAPAGRPRVTRDVLLKAATFRS